MTLYPTRGARFVITFALPFATVGSPAGAIETLETVEVQSHPLGDHGALELARPTAIVDGQRLRERARPGVGQALEGVPGIHTSDFGQGASRPILRGLGGPRVRVLQDGIGSLDASSLSDDHAVALDTLAVRQAEVLMGPASLLYGSGASGGVVNLVTDRIPMTQPKDFDARLDLRHDSATVERQTGLQIDAPIGPFALHLDGVDRDTNSYQAGNGKVPNSAVQLDNHAVGVGWFGTRTELGVGHERFATLYGIPGGEQSIDMASDRYSARAVMSDPLPGLTRLTARVAHVDYAHTEQESEDGAVEIAAQFNNRETESRVEALHEAIFGWRGAVGVQHIARDFSATGAEAFVSGPIDRHDTGVFWVGEHDRGAFHHELGLRGEVVRNHPRAAQGPDTDFLVWSASAGSTWQFQPTWNVALAWTLAQRAPAIEELYANGPHGATGTFEVGQTDLSPERSNNVDLTLRRRSGRVELTASLYANRIEDFIFLANVDANGDGVTDRLDERGLPADPEAEASFLSTRYAQQDAWFAGAEAEAGVRLIEDGRGELNASLRFDAVQARLDGGARIPRLPPIRVGGALAWTRGPWAADLDLLRVARQEVTAIGETATDGHTLLEFGLARDARLGGVDYRFHARGLNLLDETARRHTSFRKAQAPLPGRSLMAGMSVSF